jgi:DNA (cytosine-5)-methyltransferase 1
MSEVGSWLSGTDAGDGHTGDCADCAIDLAFLRASRRPNTESVLPSIRVVDLFCGGGGLSLGIAEGARRLGRGHEVALAVESDALAVYERNFPEANLLRRDMCLA